MTRIAEIVVREERRGGEYRKLEARIDRQGNLVLDGYDVGSIVKEIWGDADYEYARKVPAKYKDTVLLWLMRERFESDGAFKEWLDARQIPSGFESWT